MIKFDVIIPTKNRPRDLLNLLDSISSSTELPTSVIIVDQSESYIPIKNYPGLNIKHIHNRVVTGLTSAKNFGVSQCSSDVVYFFDDDIILDSNFFETINGHFAQNECIAGICGRQKNSKSSRFKVMLFEILHRGPFKDIRKRCNSGQEGALLKSSSILPGGITAYRSFVFEEFMFDEALIKYCLGEDMDFSYRVSKKYKLAFATNALALHNHSTIGRYEPKLSFSSKVAGYSYFYKKNVNKTICSRFQYFLVQFGVVLDALQYCLLNLDASSISGVLSGYKNIRNGYRNVAFIDMRKLPWK